MRSTLARPAAWLAASLPALLLWDASGLDLALAGLAGNAHGFPWRDSWLLGAVMHDGARALAWALLIALCLGIAMPVGFLRRLPVQRRVQLAASALAASAFIAVMKAGSSTSCPWDLEVFGGVARYVPHWTRSLLGDGGPGHCFPAGHASAGFAFVGGYFALRHDMPRLARRWLAAAVIAGLALGLSQQLRGAHFMSHTLWTAWFCGVAGWAIDRVFAARLSPVPDPAR